MDWWTLLNLFLNAGRSFATVSWGAMLLGIAQLCGWWSLITKTDTLAPVDFSLVLEFLQLEISTVKKVGWGHLWLRAVARYSAQLSLRFATWVKNPSGTSGSLAAKASLKRRPKRTMSRGFGTGTRSSFTFRTVSDSGNGWWQCNGSTGFSWWRCTTVAPTPADSAAEFPSQESAIFNIETAKSDVRGTNMY